jgi:hypothetical protein
MKESLRDLTVPTSKWIVGDLFGQVNSIRTFSYLLSELLILQKSKLLRILPVFNIVVIIDLTKNYAIKTVDFRQTIHFEIEDTIMKSLLKEGQNFRKGNVFVLP